MKCALCGKDIIQKKNHPKDPVRWSLRVFPRAVEDSEEGSKIFMCSKRVQYIHIDKFAATQSAKIQSIK